ncbi:CDC27 family protein [Candidatus Bathyarchaeota archaeon]|nr:CDC27 family protein [Candidatus Bathyarchaeota archaeon]
MMDARLRVVHEFLDSDLNENALFLSERLHALEPDNSSWPHLTALSYLRLGRVSLALEHSREKGLKGSHLGCSYVFAQACLKQKKYVDGITALRQAHPLWGGTHSSLDTRWNVVSLTWNWSCRWPGHV